MIKINGVCVCVNILSEFRFYIRLIVLKSKSSKFFYNFLIYYSYSLGNFR